MKNSFFAKFYRMLIAVGSNLQSLFLLAIRLFWGGSFFLAGLGKLQNIPGLAESFTDLGIPFPLVNAYVASLIECIGGACLFLGLGSRLAALSLIIVMAVALSTAHRDVLLGVFDDPQKFVSQLAFVYLFANLVIFIFGPGKISVDHVIEKKIN